MNPIERKLYNANYYSQNKNKSNYKSNIKVACIICEKLVIKKHIQKHYQSKLCLMVREVWQATFARENLKLQE